VKKRNIIAGLLLALGLGTAQAEQVTVAVAANFTDATKAIVPEFEKATGHTARISYGSTGKLYAQIENGAPFDVFLAADVRRPKLLEEKGVTVEGTRFTYARGQLVLWTPGGQLQEEGDAVLKEGDFRKLAMANPKTAPYGLAARQVMESLALYESLYPKLVRGDSIAQTFQFVATENADLGFVALSQVRALADADRGSSWSIPPELYQPIEQQAVLLKRGEDNPAAKAWLAFIQGKTARAIIEGFGYGVE